MVKKGWSVILALAVTAGLMAGCGSAGKSGTVPEETQTVAETTETAESESSLAETSQTAAEESEEVFLEDLAGLLGMQDADTADLLGGGEENWTEDRSFYIGRIYQAEVEGVPCEVFTTCGEDKTVESVSLWIVGGERAVTEEETEQWKTLVTEMMGTEPSCDEEPSEAGSKNCTWMSNGIIATMSQMTDILTVSFQPAVGELN